MQNSEKGSGKSTTSRLSTRGEYIYPADTSKSAAWVVDSLCCCLGCCQLVHNGIHLILSSPMLDAWHKDDLQGMA